MKRTTLTFILSSLWFSIHTTFHPFTVVLDPGTGYEPAILQASTEYLEAVRETVENAFPQARIVLARTGQERVDHTQSASFSNRLQTDLHVSFNFAAHKNNSSDVHVYTCTDTSHQTIAPKPSQDLSFIPVSTAYLGKQKESQKCASLFVTTVKTIGTVPIVSPAKLPLKALQGVLAPSFLIELSLTPSRDRKTSLDAICEGLTKLINQLLIKQTE